MALGPLRVLWGRQPLLYRGRPLVFRNRYRFDEILSAILPVPWGAVTTAARHRAFLSTGFRRPEVQRALREKADELGGRAALGRWLREQIYPDAIALALTERGKRWIRLGVHWLKDERDRRLLVHPAELPREKFLAWLRQATRRHAEEIISGMKRSRLAEKRTVTILPAALDALTWQVAAFSGRQFAGAVYGRRLSPADRTLLRLREAGVTYAEIGRTLGISTAAVKQRVYRLRRPRISSPG
jgi:DNA-binding CsgD family transcriptional regulator